MRTIEDLIAGIQARHDDLDAYAETAESLGKAPEGLVEIMRDLRVPLVKAPASIGGDELSMMDQVQYFEALAYSNPTAGWTGFNHAGAAGMCGARLNDAGIEEIFGSNPAPFFGAVGRRADFAVQPAPKGRSDRHRPTLPAGRGCGLPARVRRLLRPAGRRCGHEPRPSPSPREPRQH